MFGKLGVVSLVFLISLATWAAGDAIVITDGAMVYKNSDFDSQVLGYMQAGRAVKISSKKFGAFYRVQLRQGVIGYISDVDVQVKGASGSLEETDKKKADKKKTAEKVRRPILNGSYLGVTGSYSQYAETIDKKEYRENIMLYGIKYTGNMPFFDGPFLTDISVTTSMAAPEYYKKISDAGTTPTGSIYLGDLLILFPMYEAGRDSAFYLGAGMMWTVSNVTIKRAGISVPLSELRIGGEVSFTMATRIGAVAVRFEPKYYFEKSNYYAGTIALQFEL